MTSGTKVSLQSRPSFYSASGGRCWSRTSSGSSEPATSAKFARVVNYIFPLPCRLSGGLFRKVHLDTMVMPRSAGYRYIIQARCALTAYPEWRMLHSENASALTSFLFEDILCHWGALAEIVTDNGPAFVQALNVLANRYNIRHIHISPYNSQANGVVEWHHHLDVRKAIIKSTLGGEFRWHTVAHSVFWAERVTVLRSTGLSPYFMVHGVEPLFPFDLAEATFLVPPPDT